MMLFRVGNGAILVGADIHPDRRGVVRYRQSQPLKTDLDVLLLDGEYRQTLATMREYARVGLRVGAAACASEANWAPSLKSRFCSTRAVLPEFSTDIEAYVDAVLALLDE